MPPISRINPTLNRVVDATRPSHEAFHAAVKKAMETSAKGDKEGGVKLIYGEMKEAREKTFEGFAALLAEATKATDLEGQLGQQEMVVCRASMDKALDMLDKIVEINTKIAGDTAKSSMAMAGSLKMLNLLAAIIGVVAALGLGFLISRSINNALRRIAASLGNGAEQTASSAGQVAQSSQSMAEGASEQASSLEETPASLEELTSMTKQNADNANQAVNLMAQAKEVVGGMARSTEEMSKAISEIKASADQTAKIIKTIDEIAFQTNLLALNAAVEAARAGDAGKGFAVVAEEVRNLAQRSAEAAKNTTAMIEGSVRNAENGVEVSKRVAESLQQTVANAGNVAQLINEIAAASNEQSQGIDQINTAVAQMDQVTQSNAANSEESASASEELSAQAEEMKRMVQDLVAIVGSSSRSDGGAQSVGTTVRVHQAAQGGAAKTVKPQRKAGAFPARASVGHATVVKQQQAALPAPGSEGRTAVKPQQAIPLDDDDLKDF